jgi:hypothetical protein
MEVVMLPSLFIGFDFLYRRICMMKRFLLALLPLALVLAGCGDGGVAPADDHIGTYDLVSINGQLPYGDPDLQTISATLVMKADKTWSQTVTFRETDTEGVVTTGTLTEEGSWRRSGSKLILTDRLGDYEAVYQNGRLTADIIPGPVVWEKR